MSQKLKHFHEKSYPDVMAFMRDLRESFDNEFDTGLVMAEMWRKLDELWEHVGKKNSGYWIETYFRPHYKPDGHLSVRFLSMENHNAMFSAFLIERLGSVAVKREVLEKEQPVAPKVDLKTDLSIAKALDWTKARDLMMANPRFSSTAITAFEATMKSVKPRDETTPWHVRISETHQGVAMAVIVAGKNVLAMGIDFSYNA